MGRGIGGKYLSAVDVTGIGPYTLRARDTGAPIPLWSRGNPDTADGMLNGARNNTDGDYNAYLGMGQTWSVPTVAWIGSLYKDPVYTTPRRPSTNKALGPDFVLFVGSGFGDNANEGRTFYTLDALSGDVIASSPPNAGDGVLVANPAGFNPEAYAPLNPIHPAGDPVTRVYVGDTAGRVHKFLTANPGKRILFADLGATQPVGTAAALLGLVESDPTTSVPHVYITTGNDLRLTTGPFQVAGYRDDGSDTADVSGAVQLFKNNFDNPGEALCPNRTLESFFRGTVQPATVIECGQLTAGKCTEMLGRVFYGGTRISHINARFAPPNPLACNGNGDYPCRSSFDSILYGVGATTGESAYTTSGGDAIPYKLLVDSRIQAIGMQADPSPLRGGSSLNVDVGRLTGAVTPPPPPGTQAWTSQTTPNVFMKREEGQPPPAVRYGSVVCQ